MQIPRANGSVMPPGMVFALVIGKILLAVFLDARDEVCSVFATHVFYAEIIDN